MANKIIVPAMTAMKFPVTEVSYPDGISVKLPITSENVNTAKSDVPKASVLCLSFRASSLVRKIVNLVQLCCFPFVFLKPKYSLCSYNEERELFIAVCTCNSSS